MAKCISGLLGALTLFLAGFQGSCASAKPAASPPGPFEAGTMEKRIVIATTSHDAKGISGEPTGAYLSEIAHPYDVFTRRGYKVEFASVRGGLIPLDGVQEADTASQAFLAHHSSELEQSFPAQEIDPSRYEAIFFAGGHGAMWDLPDSIQFARITSAIYQRGGVVAAVCHGPAALVNVKLPSGVYLVSGKAVSAFSNEEERAAKADTLVPFLLEDKLKERGALYSSAPMWQSKVIVSDRLVTGQNPASAAGVAEAVADLLEPDPKG